MYWISENFNISCTAVRDPGLKDAADIKIFNEAKQADAVVITKDVDFCILQKRFS